MNKILVDIAIARMARPKYGRPVNSGKVGLEKLIMGDVAQRDKNREAYMSDEFEKRLDEVIRRR
jgi:hypothetical protein